MNIIIKRTFITACLLFLAGGYFYAQEAILPVDQVKAGMLGKGRSVFKGTKIEEFGVEILGVLHNDPSVGAKKSIILARLSGAGLENSGVAQGMSGSPVYIDGKLVGAVAFSFAYSKEPIAGITPIGDMLAIEERIQAAPTYEAPRPIKKYLALDELFEIHKDIFQAGATEYYAGKAFTPLKIPLVFDGFSTRAFERSKSSFARMGFLPVMGGTMTASQGKISEPDLSLRPGDPVGVKLITGDLNMAATGTVTMVQGNKVLAFGHPMYNLGPVQYAMTKASVITVVPSFSTSFKMTSADNLVGRFVQDRSSGVMGELGTLPRMIPVNVSVTNISGKRNDIKIQVVEDKILTPFMVNSVVSSILMTDERSIGDLSLILKGNVFLESGDSIPLEDLFSGNFDASVANIANLVISVTYFITNNEFRDLAIHRIDLDFQLTEDIRLAYLEKVWLDKYDVAPGEIISIKVFTRNFRGQGEIVPAAVPAPNLPSGSEFQLIVADTRSLQMIERAQYKSQSFTPRSLDQLIRLLSNQRKNNRIYFKIIAEKPGLFLKGEELPNLPPTMKSMFTSRRAATSSPTELTRSTLVQYQQPVPYVFQGLAVIPVKIK